MNEICSTINERNGKKNMNNLAKGLSRGELIAYYEFCKREYDDSRSFEDFLNDKDLLKGFIGIAFTTYGENEEHDIQCDFDLCTDEYKYYLDDKLIYTEKVERENLIEDLKHGDFEGFISDGIWKASEILGMEY